MNFKIGDKVKLKKWKKEWRVSSYRFNDNNDPTTLTITYVSYYPIPFYEVKENDKLYNDDVLVRSSKYVTND